MEKRNSLSTKKGMIKEPHTSRLKQCRLWRRGSRCKISISNFSDCSSASQMGSSNSVRGWLSVPIYWSWSDPGHCECVELSFANRNGWPRLLPEYVWEFVLVHSVKWKFATIRALGNHSRCIVDMFRLAMAFCGTGCPSRRSCCMSRHLRERILAS